MLTNFAIKQYAKYRYNYLNKLKPQALKIKKLVVFVLIKKIFNFIKEIFLLFIVFLIG